MPQIAYLSLGSNVGGRAAQLRDAQARLSAAGRVIAVSSLYETEPMEFAEQPWFVNCALTLETDRTAPQLMSIILAIEAQMGRKRVQSKGPRSIDIDILLFGGAVIDSPELTVPHPAMHQRRFVLEPLAEIAPQIRHPVLKKTVSELLAALPEGQSVRRMQSSRLANEQPPTANDPSKAQ